MSIGSENSSSPFSFKYDGNTSIGSTYEVPDSSYKGFQGSYSGEGFKAKPKINIPNQFSQFNTPNYQKSTDYASQVKGEADKYRTDRKFQTDQLKTYIDGQNSYKKSLQDGYERERNRAFQQDQQTQRLFAQA